MTKFALATIEEKTDVEIFTGDYLDILTVEIQAEVDSHEADLSTEASRKKTKSFAAKIAKAKVRADEAGKNLNAERRTLNEKVDERRRKLRDDFDRMRDQARKPVTEWEAAEELREEAEREAIKIELDHIEALRLNDEEDRTRAIVRKEAELKAKAESLRLAEVERLAKEEAAQAEQMRIERDAEVKRQAEETAKQEAQEAIDRAEREKQEAIDNAERDRLLAIEDAKNAEIEAAKAQERQRIAAEQEKERAVKSERDRIAAEELAQQKATERREADKKHKTKIQNKAVVDLTFALGIHAVHAREIVEAVDSGKISSITISY